MYRVTNCYEEVILENEMVLFPENDSKETNALILGEGTRLVYEALKKEPLDGDKLCALLLGKYEVSYEQVRNDLDKLLSDFERFGVIAVD